MTTTMLDRLKAALPSSWFRDDTPIIDAILSGYAWCLTSIQDDIDESKNQTRIKTTTGGFLDLTSGDFFGESLPRLLGESDPTFGVRIIRNIVSEKATFGAVHGAVVDIMAGTGATINMYELGTSPVIHSNSFEVGLDLLDIPSRIGTPLQPFEAFIHISGSGVYIDDTLYASLIDIISRIKPIGTVVWVYTSSLVEHLSSTYIAIGNSVGITVTTQPHP